MNIVIFFDKTIYMNKFYLIENPDLFQGRKYLNTNKNYFEGWYFKNTNSEEGISFIPGISIEEDNKKSFIQVITNNSSYFINYNIEDFEFNINPFYIKIANNTFSKDGVYIDINDEKQNLSVYGDIQYSDSKNIRTNFLNPNIMGPFSYVPFMECNHAILSMQNNACGLININNKLINFNNGIGYIEKDWGCSFPKDYIWCQANNFDKSNCNFMLSVADIPFKIFNFKGLICVLMIDNKEFKFTTYNNSKLVKCDVNNNFLNIILRKGKYILDIKSNYEMGNRLSAPVRGKMEKDIFESISSLISVTLKEDNNIIFSDTSKNCGLEIVKDNLDK